MGMVVSMLAPMAVCAPDGETGHSYWLAPPRVPLVLDLEGPTRTAGRPSVPRETRELIRILSRNNSTQLAESLHRLKLAGCTIATSASPNYLPLQFL